MFIILFIKFIFNMRISFYKKLLSFVSIVALLGSQIGSMVSVSALTAQPTLVTPTLEPIGITQYQAVVPTFNPSVVIDSNVGNFLVNSNVSTNKEILELAPITYSNA